ncbi:hypothetical protein [Streptomyces sp. NPDC050564]|uniref:hypothetical protein n=1 Tax=Streptomyces sp. NPDC050564 TaxID=3365631 RepID=UPI0037B779E2
MSAHLGGPPRLPASEVPDGCRPWDGESARRWTDALPPRGVPLRIRPWFNGLRRTRHIAWDHIGVVRCKGAELKVDSHRASFDEWTAFGPSWPWLERKLRLIHPYERTAAEITAMWRDPALRPTAESGERERGRRLWPLAVVLGVVWVATTVLLP